jgi:hypothetical protein
MLQAKKKLFDAVSLGGGQNLKNIFLDVYDNSGL